MNNFEIAQKIRTATEPLPLSLLVESGLLWWINAKAFHDEGFKLMLTHNESGEVLGFNLAGNGSDRIWHDSATAAIRGEAIKELFVPNLAEPQIDFKQWRLE